MFGKVAVFASLIALAACQQFYEVNRYSEDNQHVYHYGNNIGKGQHFKGSEYKPFFPSFVTPKPPVAGFPPGHHPHPHESHYVINGPPYPHIVQGSPSQHQGLQPYLDGSKEGIVAFQYDDNPDEEDENQYRFYPNNYQEPYFPPHPPTYPNGYGDPYQGPFYSEGPYDYIYANPPYAPHNPSRGPSYAPQNPYLGPWYAPQNPYLGLWYAPQNPYPGPSYLPQNPYLGPSYAPQNPYPGPSYLPQNPYLGPSYTPQNPYPGPSYASQNPYPGPSYASQNPYPGPSYASQNPYPGPLYTPQNPYPGPSYAPRIPYRKRPYVPQIPFKGSRMLVKSRTKDQECSSNPVQRIKNARQIPYQGSRMLVKSRTKDKVCSSNPAPNAPCEDPYYTLKARNKD